MQLTVSNLVEIVNIFNKHFATLAGKTKTSLNCPYKIFTFSESRRESPSNYSFFYIQLRKKKLKWLFCWIPNPGVLVSKPLSGFKPDSALHSSNVNQRSTRTSWGLDDKKTVSS